MDELGVARDAALTNVGNFALDIWGKVARTGGSNEASDATAVGESTSTSSESGTKSASTSEDNT